jgi:hypothetical protein
MKLISFFNIKQCQKSSVKSKVLLPTTTNCKEHLLKQVLLLVSVLLNAYHKMKTKGAGGQTPWKGMQRTNPTNGRKEIVASSLFQASAQQ